jgi:hypothetical protein
MFGHVAGRPRRWPWVVLSFLFAMAFASSFAVTEVMTEVQIDEDVLSIIRIGTAVGLGLSLLLLVFASISSRRRRRARVEDDGRAADDEGQAERSGGTHGRTYEEVFGVRHDLDEGDVPIAPEGEEWESDGKMTAEGDGQRSTEDKAAEVAAPPSEEDLQSLQADLDEPVDQVESPDADDADADADGDVDSDDHLRRIREEFKARVEEAALRVKQREAEPHEAASAPNPE